MSTHPNALLILSLTPDDLSRKTHRAIMAEAGVTEDDRIKIGDDDYLHRVMEDSYDQSHQIAASEGDIVLFDHVTYGYGKTVEWDKLEAQKQVLEAWAKAACARHHCSYRILVSANYW